MIIYEIWKLNLYLKFRVHFPSVLGILLHPMKAVLSFSEYTGTKASIIYSFPLCSSFSISASFFNKSYVFTLNRLLAKFFHFLFPFPLVHSLSLIKYAFISIPYNKVFHSPGDFFRRSLRVTSLTLLILKDFVKKMTPVQKKRYISH